MTFIDRLTDYLCLARAMLLESKSGAKDALNCLRAGPKSHKFRPIWETRFLLFSATRDLPRIAISALEAEAFLVRPRLMRRRVARTDEPVLVEAGTGL